MANQTTIQVEGMTCGHCESAVKNAVEAVDGVKQASASKDNKTVTILYEGELNSAEIKQAIEDAGYTVTLL